MIYPFIFIVLFVCILAIIQEGYNKYWERLNLKSRIKNAVWNKRQFRMERLRKNI